MSCRALPRLPWGGGGGGGPPASPRRETSPPRPPLRSGRGGRKQSILFVFLFSLPTCVVVHVADHPAVDVAQHVRVHRVRARVGAQQDIGPGAVKGQEVAPSQLERYHLVRGPVSDQHP